MAYDPVISRIERFPGIVDDTMARVRALEAEARRYGDRHILARLEAVNRAWNDAIEHAQDRAIERGGSVGFCEDRR